MTIPICPNCSIAYLSIELILQLLQEVGVSVQGTDGTLHVLRHGGRRLEAGVEHERPLELFDGNLRATAQSGATMSNAVACNTVGEGVALTSIVCRLWDSFLL